MKAAGIIAEYNPFHNGHQYQINELRQRTGVNYVIAAMSGNFLQRGVPAIADKYVRAKAALLSGVDLVLELPVCYATASAEFFARGGVLTLTSTGVVSHLGFGVELPSANVTDAPRPGDPAPESEQCALLTQLAAILAAEPQPYARRLREYLKQGVSFPKARELALVDFLKTDAAPSLPFHADTDIDRTIHDFLSLPNNILALEYEKALFLPGLSDRPEAVPILRQGDGYHETEIGSRYASAAAIRRLLLAAPKALSSDASGSGGFDGRQTSLLQCRDLMPEASYQLFAEYQAHGAFLSEESVSQLLGYRLHLLSRTGYTDFADCTPQLSARLQNSLPDYRGFSRFCELLSSKDLTRARISRVLLHILLDIKKSDLTSVCTLSAAPYLRVLGFRESASPLLAAIKKEASAPLVTKVADASRQLSEDAYEIFRKDLLASDIYRMLLPENSIPENDFRRSPVIIS